MRRRRTKNTKDIAESADEYERTEERDIEVDLIYLVVTRQRIGLLSAFPSCPINVQVIIIWIIMISMDL